MPSWALSLSYWLHMLATVAWIGGLAVAGMVFLPLVARLSDPQAGFDLLHRTLRRLDALGWFSALLLTGTGLVQMSAAEQYVGFLSFGNSWSQAILLKHIVFFGMVGVSAVLTWNVMPEFGRALLRQSRGGDPPDAKLLRRLSRLLTLNLALGLVVLLFTAIARTA